MSILCPNNQLTKKTGKVVTVTILLLLTFTSIGLVQTPLAVATPTTSAPPSSSPFSSSSFEREQQEQETTTTVISSATNRSFDRIVSLADEIISLANEPGQSPDQIDETILQIGMRDHGIQMLAEEAALLPHIESIFGQGSTITAGSATTTANGATNNDTASTISPEGSGTNIASETELKVTNNTLSGLSETTNETSAAAEGIGLQDINSLFTSISNIAQEIRDMASQQYTTNEEIDNTAHAIIMRSEGIISLLRDLDIVTQIRENFLATSNRNSPSQQ
jgi:hypothetical protein